MTAGPTEAHLGAVPALRDPGPGLIVLDPDQARLFHLLDGLFVGVAERFGAAPVVGPPLLPAADLVRLDYFRNFPHLGVLAARLTPEATAEAAAGADPTALDTVPTGYLLPSATCYGLLTAMTGVRLDAPVRLSATGRCFRNEERFEGLRRLWGFHMREILFVGDQDGAAGHLNVSREMILDLANRLGVPVTVEAANDPFYDRTGSRARLAMLDPVKHEFVTVDGTAIASVNRHRNFFGERLDIRLGADNAYSSCTAFGVERWIHAMVCAHGSVRAALAVAERASG
ncbi:aminoacyl--tRNA ligase-related protein [Verrucosispora sp. WMMD1129]|uniref:aminoacyl--tRNA ligase-related protein n=1 Tax=Verrucosispora sp. WMMD1129 TaxID=3016093 RepID=UPI00249AEEB9|nr:aminoacyl--tRNA ligase-related protein [Verrucosispora sp. WMMD1129]WFE47857.1 hypothetical protein O7624_27720 [Verrucosispora sp. WMMD1129]